MSKPTPQTCPTCGSKWRSIKIGKCLSERNPRTGMYTQILDPWHEVEPTPQTFEEELLDILALRPPEERHRLREAHQRELAEARKSAECYHVWLGGEERCRHCGMHWQQVVRTQEFERRAEQREDK